MFCHRFLTGTFLTLALVVCLAIPSMATTWTVISTADDGSSGTLRSLIAEAASGDTINFSVTGTITLVLGVLEISQNLTINGPGPANLAISGNNGLNNVNAVFQIDSGATVSISGVTIENGGASGGFGLGGVYNAGTLILNNCTLSGNFGTRGAIFSAGTLTVTNSTFSGNSCIAPQCSAGINTGARATVTNSTFSGIGNGITNENQGTLTVTNSTFSGTGTAINNLSTLMVSFSTFSGGGFLGSGRSTATVKNTLLANSSGCYPNIVSDGHNLSDNTSCASIFTAIGDLNNTPAGLDPNGLQSNGGPTQTIALLPTSPAVNAIPLTPTNYCTDVAGNPVITDQRGVTRPQGTGCDIGAFELTASVAGLLDLVKGISLPAGVQTVLTLTLTAAEEAPNKTVECLDLTAFTFEVDLAKVLRELTATEASQLITEINQVKTGLSCP